MAATENAPSTEPTAGTAAAVIADVDAALAAALDPAAHSNAEGVATLVRAALAAHR